MQCDCETYSSLSGIPSTEDGLLRVVMYQMGHDIIERPKIEDLSTVRAAPKVFPFRGRKFFVFVRFHPSPLVRGRECNRSLRLKTIPKG
jgi:hypothetical protein